MDGPEEGPEEAERIILAEVVEVDLGEDRAAHEQFGGDTIFPQALPVEDLYLYGDPSSVWVHPHDVIIL